MVKVSVVIPCYNKASVILEVLKSLLRQTVSPSHFEVLIVDDGSTDGTNEIVSALSLPSSFHFLYQQNQGAAAARNLGVRKARGDLILFLDGDVVADSRLLEAHIKSHKEHVQALVMGRLKELPHEKINIFSETVHSIAIFDHGEVKKELLFIDGFTGNLSLKRSVFWQIGEFDTIFPRSGFEDTEFIYRAVCAGYGVLYNPQAIGYHDGLMTFQESCQHLRSYQASAVLLMNKHPEIVGQIPHLRDKEPIRWKKDAPPLVVRKLARRLLALPASVALMKLVIKGLEKWYPHPGVLYHLYWKVLGSYILLGLRDGMRQYGSPFK